MARDAGVRGRWCDGTVVDRDGVDAVSAKWLDALCADGPGRDEAIRQLHELLLRAARWQVARLRAELARPGRQAMDDLAEQAADDATVAVLDRLATYQGRALFTTWAYKFAILHASVAVRQAAWQRREVPVEPTAWPLMADRDPPPDVAADVAALADALRAAVAHVLTPHQRTVLVALTVNDVPVDVLAARLGTTRGAVYKTLHDARGRLRRELAGQGFDVDPLLERERRDR
jgi:RNA polymerase sigma-70 factor (ECF subfamily)